VLVTHPARPADLAVVGWGESRLHPIEREEDPHDGNDEKDVS
jgi:hypothetical protein